MNHRKLSNSNTFRRINTAIYAVDSTISDCDPPIGHISIKINCKEKSMEMSSYEVLPELPLYHPDNPLGSRPGMVNSCVAVSGVPPAGRLLLLVASPIGCLG
jgi:hypothetical protein